MNGHEYFVLILFWFFFATVIEPFTILILPYFDQLFGISSYFYYVIDIINFHQVDYQQFIWNYAVSKFYQKWQILQL